MKQAEIEVGRQYVAKVSGRLVRVLVLDRVEHAKQYSPRTFELLRRAGVKFRCKNLATDREITCSAARLRYAI